MASPQKENGYTPIANEILEQISRITLSGRQWRILMVVWRYTYGFKRKCHTLSHSFIESVTGIKRQNVCTEMKVLIDRNIIFVDKTSDSLTQVIGFNKDYDEWLAPSQYREHPPSQYREHPPSQYREHPPSQYREHPENDERCTEEIKAEENPLIIGADEEHTSLEIETVLEIENQERKRIKENNKKKNGKEKDICARARESPLPPEICTGEIMDPNTENPVHKIIDYLNTATGRNFKYDTAQSVKYINGRLKEGYTIQDFYSVIEKKTVEWLHDPKMTGNLCPSTLFRPANFERYVNQPFPAPFGMNETQMAAFKLLRESKSADINKNKLKDGE